MAALCMQKLSSFLLEASEGLIYAVVNLFPFVEDYRKSPVSLKCALNLILLFEL